MLYLQLLSQQNVLHELLEWLKDHQPPMCMFMPDRLPDAAASRTNQTHFEHLATTLAQNHSVSSPDNPSHALRTPVNLTDKQMHVQVAVAPWNAPDRFVRGGIILFPTGTLRNLLVGAVFFDTGFPEFIAPANTLPRSVPYSPNSGHNPYDPAPPNIAASQRHHQASGSQSRHAT